MNPVARLLAELRALARILKPEDFIALLKETLIQSPSILSTKKLTSLDASMSRNMTIRVGSSSLVLPLLEIDRILKVRNDSPTFGTVREIYARNCYLNHLKLTAPQRNVLDLGANRGMFSLLALVVLKAELVVGVEPTASYSSVYKLLLEANHCPPDRAPRYLKFITSPSIEAQDPEFNVSIQTILSDMKVDRFNLVKMDIEGHEKEVFSDPEWLASVDNITMELHPQMVGDLSLIPKALERYGFKYLLMDQNGGLAPIESAVFLVASCKEEIAFFHGESLHKVFLFLY